jgi:YHS domain-containing protein
MDKKIQWAVVGALWVLVLGALGLGYEYIHNHASGGSASQPGAPAAQVGDKVVDPVSKNEVVVGKDSPHVNYQGQDYYFESGTAQDHKLQFLMDPELYLKGVSSYQAQASALNAASTMVAVQATPRPAANPTQAPYPTALPSPSAVPTANPAATPKATPRPTSLPGGLPAWDPRGASSQDTR